MPDFLFLDRQGNELGIIRSNEHGWVIGSIVERPTGFFRVVEVFEPYLPDIDGVEAYVTVERRSTLKLTQPCAIRDRLISPAKLSRSDHSAFSCASPPSATSEPATIIAPSIERGVG